MLRRFCDRCNKDMVQQPIDSTTFLLTEGEGELARQWRVGVSAPRERDLCVDCRKVVVAKGKAV